MTGDDYKTYLWPQKTLLPNPIYKLRMHTNHPVDVERLGHLCAHARRLREEHEVCEVVVERVCEPEEAVLE